MRHAAHLATSFVLSIACSGLAQPASDANPPPEPQNNRFVQTLKGKKWTVTTTITLAAYGDVDRRAVRLPDGTTQRSDRYEQDSWVFDELMVLLPVMVSSASAVRPNDETRGTLTINDVVVDDDPTITTPYQSQAIYARWDAPRGVGGSLRLIQTQDLVCYETVYDEQAAGELDWPDAWPPEADSTFAAQQFVNASNPDAKQGEPDPIDALLKEWTDGQDPKSIKPAELAKWLAGRVQEHVRIVRSSTTSRRASDTDMVANIGLSSGFEVQDAYKTAVEGKGTKHDITVLLAAVYRRAGLPARIVIGYGKFDRKKKGKRAKESDRVRSWVEFALFDGGDPDDQEDDVLAWVPVDIAAMRGRSSRAGKMERSWKYFGTNDELREVVPLAFHFHPPTEVRSYAAPALFGWTMSPATPDRADQYINIQMNRMPNRGGG